MLAQGLVGRQRVRPNLQNSIDVQEWWPGTESIAIQTYFQKIADPEDIASSAGVSFTINHIAAVIVPVALGLVWVISHSAVFLIGTGFALCSLILSQNIPFRPVEGNEVNGGRVRSSA